MRFSLSLLAAALILAFASPAAPAQTSKPPSKRELLRQDSEECAKQVPRLYVEPFAECVFKRQAARKAAAKQEKAARRAQQKQEREAARQARREHTRQRIEQVKIERAKRAECSKQARAQKLPLGQRPAFIANCMGK
ncbi:MAG TPA: hypothetical protein VFB29_03495 [Pseudolabrys sp.]|nr:hypothetical protein [Pseudolabrys sp.]